MVPHLAHSEHAEEGFSQSFALQFISLILFILIFVVTSFSGNIQSDQTTTSELQELSNALGVKNYISEKVIFEQRLTPEYFSENFQSLQITLWQPIFEMLTDHDVSIVVTVSADSLKEKLSKAESIYSLLLEVGVPTEALRVETDIKTKNDSLKLIKGDVSW